MRASTRRKRERQGIQSELGRVDRMGKKVLEQARLHHKMNPNDFKIYADDYAERLEVTQALRRKALARLHEMKQPPSEEPSVESLPDAYMEGSESLPLAPVDNPLLENADVPHT